MKKYKELFKLILTILISFLLYVGLLLLCLPKGLNILWFILLQIIGLPLSLFMFVAFHEFGHFVFGKTSGYEFVSFKVGPFEWKRENEKICFRVVPQNILILGQCLMGPPKPKKKKQPKFYLYNAGGLIFSYSENILFILLIIFVPVLYVKWLLLPMVLIGVFLTINNSMYSKYGVNDVCNHINVKNNPKYIDSIMYQLEMLANTTKGKRYGAKCLYNGYFEENLNHITIPVVQFKFYQAIEHDRFDEAKELSSVMKRNYNKMIFWIQRLAFYFEILYADIVLEMDMNAFRRDFKRLGSKEKMYCSKEGSDVYFYYKIFESIYNKEYNIEQIVAELLKQDGFTSGERLSLEKKYGFLISKLNFYINNNYSFVEKSDSNEIL
jgi:hypothetical protein